jgi:general secretion pathway protein F
VRFELLIVDEEGALVRRRVEAASVSAARASVRGQERALSCRPVASRGFGRTRAGRTDRLSFCEALEQVLAGGLTLAEALRALAADEESGGASLARAVLRGLDRGLAPSDAFEATGHDWSPFLVALLRSGERSGQLPAALARFVASERSLLEMRARVVSASVYPVVLLAVSGLVLLFLLGFVVPKFAAALDDLRADLPVASRVLFEVGRWIGQHTGELVAAMAAAATALGVLAASGPFRRRAAASLLRVPGLRAIADLAGRAQAMRVSAALLSGGATFPAALEVARATSGVSVGARLERARTLVEGGATPSSALAAADLAGPVAARLLSAAERTGGLAACFERLATADEIRLTRLLERAAAAWGPLLMLGVAALVGGVVMALYWPMLQVFESIQ